MRVQYKDVEGYPGYLISSNGNVWSSRRKWKSGFKWKLLHPVEANVGDGYLRATIHKSWKVYRKVNLNILVLEAFVGKCPKGMQTRHLDGNPQNNQLENLKWGTAKENAMDRDRHGTTAHCKGEKNGMAKLSDKAVEEIKILLRAGMRPCNVAREYKTSQTVICRISKNKTWKHIKI